MHVSKCKVKKMFLEKRNRKREKAVNLGSGPGLLPHPLTAQDPYLVAHGLCLVGDTGVVTLTV